MSYKTKVHVRAQALAVLNNLYDNLANFILYFLYLSKIHCIV